MWSGPGDTPNLTWGDVEMVRNLASVATVATLWFWRGSSLTGLASRVGESLGHYPFGNVRTGLRLCPILANSPKFYAPVGH